MAEWLNATVLKTVVRESGPGVRIPQLPLIIKDMTISKTADDGIIYQLEIGLENIGPILVHIDYEIRDGILFYDTAMVEPDDNPGLTPYEIYQSNDEIHARWEEPIQKFLTQLYANTGIEYQSKHI